MYELCEDAELGILPILAGSLDQTACFIDCRRFLAGEHRRWKASLGIKD